MDNITDVDTFTAQVPIPEDVVDGINATTVVQGLQALANRTKYLKNRLGDQWLVGLALVTESATTLLLDNDAQASYSDSYKLELGTLATLAGDIIEIDLMGHIDADQASAQAFRLATTLDAGTSPAAVTGAEAVFDALTADTVPLTLIGVVASASAGTTHVWLQSHGDGTYAGYFRGPYTYRVRQYRGV